jgi:hypothetical protein
MCLNKNRRFGSAKVVLLLYRRGIVCLNFTIVLA